jgi:hypothetical protein
VAFVTWTFRQYRRLDDLRDEKRCANWWEIGGWIIPFANLFVPFYTTKPGGSGIGLVLSRQIAEGHGGSLELEARPGGGARARLVLPLDPSA